MSDNDKYQSGWYESNEGHAFHAHGKDMSEETIAALKKLADAAYKHLESLPDRAPKPPTLCEQCGGEFNPLTSYDHALCNSCFMVSDHMPDDFWEDDDDDFDPEIDTLDGVDYCHGCGNVIACCECD